jgi:hypothetical protein
MLNLKLSPNDIRGDMVPSSTSPSGKGGVQSVILKKGISLYSPSGAFRFTLQADGNPVIEVVNDAVLPRAWQSGQPLELDTIPWTVIWNNNTNDQGISEVDMQWDGNLVAYNGTGPDRNGTLPSNTNGNQGAFLRMQDDGNLVIYSSDGAALWASDTNARV